MHKSQPERTKGIQASQWVDSTVHGDIASSVAGVLIDPYIAASMHSRQVQQPQQMQHNKGKMIHITTNRDDCKQKALYPMYDFTCGSSVKMLSSLYGVLIRPSIVYV